MHLPTLPLYIYRLVVALPALHHATHVAGCHLLIEGCIHSSLLSCARSPRICIILIVQEITVTYAYRRAVQEIKSDFVQSNLGCEGTVVQRWASEVCLMGP